MKMTQAFPLMGVLVGLSLPLTGCQHVRGGHRIQSEASRFILPGSTTRAEIISNFGPASIDLKEKRVIAYTWQTERGATSFQPGFPAFGWKEKADEEILGLSDWAFCVRFDERDRVLQSQTVQATSTNCISNAVSDWAK